MKIRPSQSRGEIIDLAFMLVYFVFDAIEELRKGGYVCPPEMEKMTQRLIERLQEFRQNLLCK